MSQESVNQEEPQDGYQIRGENERLKGWVPIKDLDCSEKHPFFEKCLFLEGFDISSNIYALKGDHLSLIDAGNDYTAFIQLFHQGYKPEDIRKVFLTHGHPEHVMGLLELFRYPSVQQTKNIEVFVGDGTPESLVNVVTEFGCKITQVKNGDVIDLSGFPMRVLHTPGHTLDSICLLHEETRSVFTGDTVLPFAAATPDEIGGGRQDYLLFSVKVLRNMNIQNIFPGHGMPVLGREAAQKVLDGNYAGAIKRIVGLSTSWIDGAAFLVRKGYLEECLFCCERELDENPDALPVLELRASCLSDLGRFKEAIEAFDDLLGRKEEYPFALLGKGFALMGLEKYEEALPLLDMVIDIDPASQHAKSARMYKGMALYLLGRYDEAMDIEDFREEFVERFKESIKQKKARGSIGKDPFGKPGERRGRRRGRK